MDPWRRGVKTKLAAVVSILMRTIFNTVSAPSVTHVIILTTTFIGANGNIYILLFI